MGLSDFPFPFLFQRIKCYGFKAFKLPGIGAFGRNKYSSSVSMFFVHIKTRPTSEVQNQNKKVNSPNVIGPI